jgi:DNA-binding NarL/FixJ family response regulator
LATDTDSLPAEVGLALVDTDAESAISFIELCARRYPQAPIVALGTTLDSDFVDKALTAGAHGYLPQSYSETVILGVLRLVLSGASYRPGTPRQEHPVPGVTSVSPVSVDEPAEVMHEFGLSGRQQEVLSLAAQGKSNQSIAKQLGITEGTVKLHMSAIFKALNVENRSEAVLVASRMNSINFRQIKEAEGGRLDLDWLLPHMTHQRLRKDEIVFRKGDPGRQLYYLQRGTIRLQEIDAQITSGALFGEVGIFSPTHERTCTAACVTDVDLFTLTDAQVKRLYFLNPQFAIYVVHLIATHLSADRSRMI